jgi:murein DD-endopeptidase MepM/ murein hydrolase activator NlpD
MAQGDDNEYFSELINEVQGLFNNKQQFNTTPSISPYSAPSATPGNVINEPANFTAPIHDSWFNIGVFTSSPGPAHPNGHMGVDMSCPAGTPVYAFGTGIVTDVGTNSAGGNIVGIQHANDIWSYYAHLSTISTHKGDKVDQNTIIATVGNTGNAGNKATPLTTSEGGRTWPHLHFGVKENGGWVNP